MSTNYCFFCLQNCNNSWCKLFTLPCVKVPYTLPSCLALSSVLSHNIITLTWTTTVLLILHNAIQISLQINVLFVVGIRRTKLKTGTSRKCYSILGRNKNFLFPLSFFQEAKTGFGNHPASNSVSTDGVSLKINTLRTGSFKFFKPPFPGFLTILTL